MKLKTAPGPVADKILRKQIESIQKKKMAAQKIVSLEDFRELQKNIERLSILIVDDDEVMRNALKRVMSNEGFNVLSASDGIELSKVLEASRLDMILLDVNLPWVDGFELCRLIKAHHALKNVPIIMVSARKTQQDVESGFTAGCNDYVTKPFDVNHILEVVNKHIVRAG